MSEESIFPEHCEIFQDIVDGFEDELHKIENPYIKQICWNYYLSLVKRSGRPEIWSGAVDEGFTQITLPTYKGRITEDMIVDVHFPDDEKVVLTIRNKTIYERLADLDHERIMQVYYSGAGRRLLDDEYDQAIQDR